MQGTVLIAPAAAWLVPSVPVVAALDCNDLMLCNGLYVETGPQWQIINKLMAYAMFFHHTVPNMSNK